MTRDFEGHSDIVVRLRQRLSETPVLIGDSDPGVDLEADLRRALNEIERLRADNARLGGDPVTHSVLRARDPEGGWVQFRHDTTVETIHKEWCGALVTEVLPRPVLLKAGETVTVDEIRRRAEQLAAQE